MSGEEVLFQYTFGIEGNDTKVFDIILSLPQYQLKIPPSVQKPPWTELNFNRCSNCPLSADEYSHCPAALGLQDVIEFFATSYSYAEADVRISTPQRIISRRVPLQKGISSLIGLIMASSGCPKFLFLRPLVFLHLPFSTLDETMYRVLSMYLLAQFLKMKKGRMPDWNMEQLKKIYEDIHKVNQDFIKRLRSLHIQDASLNALVNLDCFAINAEFSITEGDLDGVEELFRIYTD